MSVHAWPLDSPDGVEPAYVGRTLRATTVAPFLAGASAGRPLGVRGGVRPGTPATTVQATGTTWTVQPCAGVIDPHTFASAGPYAWTIGQDETGTLEAASGSYTRWDGIYVVVDDPAEGDGTSEPAARVQYVAGTPAASPAMPPAPDRSLLLARIVVPPAGGGGPAVVWLAPYLAAAGAPIRVRSSAERDALLVLLGASAEAPLWVEHIGQANPLRGSVERHIGDRWSTVIPVGDSTPAVAQRLATQTLNPGTWQPLSPTLPHHFMAGSWYEITCRGNYSIGGANAAVSSRILATGISASPALSAHAAIDIPHRIADLWTFQATLTATVDVVHQLYANIPSTGIIVYAGASIAIKRIA